MNLPLLASHMLNISYTGISKIHTVAFDENGGTNTEGRFTFTDDSGAATVDCDTYATLTLLVKAIDGLKGFRCKPTPGLLSSMVTEKSLLTQRVVSDLATTVVERHGLAVMVFTNDYEEMPASATTGLISSVPVPVGNAPIGGLSLSCDGADAGATGNATFNFVNNPLGASNALPTVFPATDYEAAIDTESLFDSSPFMAINGVTEVKGTFQENIYGVQHIKMFSVTNGDDAVLNVKGTIKKVL